MNQTNGNSNSDALHRLHKRIQEMVGSRRPGRTPKARKEAKRRLKSKKPVGPRFGVTFHEIALTEGIDGPPISTGQRANDPIRNECGSTVRPGFDKELDRTSGVERFRDSTNSQQQGDDDNNGGGCKQPKNIEVDGGAEDPVPTAEQVKRMGVVGEILSDILDADAEHLRKGSEGQTSSTPERRSGAQRATIPSKKPTASSSTSRSVTVTQRRTGTRE